MVPLWIVVALNLCCVVLGMALEQWLRRMVQERDYARWRRAHRERMEGQVRERWEAQRARERERQPDP